MSDLDEAAVAAALPGRAVRVYPALVSTEADALAWARTGGPPGAVVVADYQVSARRKGGWPWPVEPGVGLGFSLLVRPPPPPSGPGWLYVATTTAVADVLGPAARTAWPDEVRVGPHRAAAVVVQAEPVPLAPAWAVVSVLTVDAAPPRPVLLARLVAAIEHRVSQDPASVLDDHRSRCATLDRRVTARLVPLGPASPTVEGTATEVRPDGRLVVDTGSGRRVSLHPDDVGLLEDHTRSG